MKRPIAIALLLLLYGNAYNQTNLVPNGSFENYTQCPTSYAQTQYIEDWFNPNMADPDFFASCSASQFCTLPLNYLGFQNPYHGDNCVGFAAVFMNGSSHTGGEYISVGLGESLMMNENYTLNFYIALADSSEYALKNIGAYFSSNDITNLSSPESFPFVPQIMHSSFITDTLNWTKVTGNFTAIGGEQFITIGYFRDSTDAIDTLFMNAHPVSLNSAYYFIDSVSLFKTSELTDLRKLSHKQHMHRNFYLNTSLGKSIDFFTVCGKKASSIEISDSNGKIIWKDENGKMTWQGQLSTGLECGEGIYIYIIRTNEKTITGKIILTNN